MLTGQTSFSKVMPRLWLVKMLRKPLIGIHRAAEWDCRIFILWIYNYKQLKYFMIEPFFYVQN